MVAFLAIIILLMVIDRYIYKSKVFKDFNYVKDSQRPKLLELKRELF